MIHIVAERSIPYLRGIAERVGRVTYLDNADFCPETIASADALLVRSITRCNAALLEGSRVRYIATATAGFDHIDADYCQRHGIGWSNAPGCNATAVAQWVLSALSGYALQSGYLLSGKVLGIVGVGHVGQEVERLAPALGLRTLLCDPPRAERGDEGEFVSLEEICRESDIITLHVPLSSSGAYPTRGMVDEAFVHSCRRRPILINACRGGVTQTEALLQGKREGSLRALMIDCWEAEPHISAELLAEAEVVSPHIAGFSADGKFAGSRMALGAICRHWGIELEGLMNWDEVPPPASPVIDLSGRSGEEALLYALTQTLSIPKRVGDRLRADATAFEELRKGYDYPREMRAYTIVGAPRELEDRLRRLDFSIG